MTKTKTHAHTHTHTHIYSKCRVTLRRIMNNMNHCHHYPTQCICYHCSHNEVSVWWLLQSPIAQLLFIKWHRYISMWTHTQEGIGPQLIRGKKRVCVQSRALFYATFFLFFLFSAKYFQFSLAFNYYYLYKSVKIWICINIVLGRFSFVITN